MRIITLPNGRTVRLRDYVKAWKRVKAMEPEKEVNGWEWFPVSARTILRDLRSGLQDRINQRKPYSHRGCPIEH